MSVYDRRIQDLEAQQARDQEVLKNHRKALDLLWMAVHEKPQEEAPGPKSARMGKSLGRDDA